MSVRLIHGDALQAMDGLQADLVIGSPDYFGKGKRYDGFTGKACPMEWAKGLAAIVAKSLEVAPVCMLVVNDPMIKGEYIPATSILEVECLVMGITAERPLIWHKNAPPNRRDWWGNDHERILAFKREAGSVPVWNWEAIGHEPKYKNGGKFRQRTATGERRIGGDYPQNKVARPRDVVRVTVGGGHMGSKLAHDNEAPYPEKLVEPIILALTNPGGIVLDPFLGSGTTVAVANRLGRNAIGIDCRYSQIELTRRRLLEQEAA